jgi:hypothetical protein
LGDQNQRAAAGSGFWGSDEKNHEFWVYLKNLTTGCVMYQNKTNGFPGGYLFFFKRLHNHAYMYQSWVLDLLLKLPIITSIAHPTIGKIQFLNQILIFLKTKRFSWQFRSVQLRVG